MFLIITMLIIAVLTVTILSPFVGNMGKKVSHVHAFLVTNRLGSMVNMISASPQNESVMMILNPVNCNITFYNETSFGQDIGDDEAVMGVTYLRSVVGSMQKTESGMFLFANDTQINSFNRTITGSMAAPTPIPIKKVNGVIWIGVNHSE